MINKTWYFIPVNPQPWTVPPSQPGRKGNKLYVQVGRNEANENFKEMVRDELKRLDAFMLEGAWNKITLGFWRRLDQYEDTAGRTQTKNWSDGTNMAKLTEDALQGILIQNDRANFELTWRIVQQTTETVPGILILCETFEEIPPWIIPPEFAECEHEINEAIVAAETRERLEPESIAANNVWPPRP